MKSCKIFKFDEIYKIQSNVEVHETKEFVRIKEHSHDYYEFFISDKNSLIHCVNGEKYLLNKRNGAFVFPGDRHYLASDDKGNIYIINVSVKKAFFEEYWNIFFPVTQLTKEFIGDIICLSHEKYDMMKSLFLGINATPAKYRDFYEKKIVMFLVEICIESNGQNSQDRVPEWLISVLQYMNDIANYYEGHIFEKIYKISGYSKSQFNRLFKKYMKTTPQQYYGLCKMNAASRLLLETDKDLRYIANILGFESVSHFIRLFKSVNGCTPNKYRIEQNNNGSK